MGGVAPKVRLETTGITPYPMETATKGDSMLTVTVLLRVVPGIPVSVLERYRLASYLSGFAES